MIINCLFFISHGGVSGLGIIMLLLAAPFALILLILTKIISMYLEQFHSFFRIEGYRSYFHLWFMYTVIIICIAMKNCG